MVSRSGHRTNGDGQPSASTNWLGSLRKLAGTRSLGQWWSEGEAETEKPWLKHYPQGLPVELSYPHQRLGWLLEQAAERFPNRAVCRYYHEMLTYEELLSRSQRLAATFAREGLKPGDRVGILLPNLPESLIAHFATWMAGGVVVSLSPLMVADEVVAMTTATECRVVVTLDVLSPLVCHGDRPPELVVLSTLAGRLSQLEKLGYAWVRLQKIGFGSACPQTRVVWLEDALKSSVRECPGGSGPTHDPAFVLPTGGTTGAPKAVTLSHANLMAQAWQLSHWSRAHHGEETILAVLPFFHSYGLSATVMTGMALGATLVLHHRFRPASVVRLIETHRPTMMLAVPAMLSALNTQVLRKEKHDLSSVRTVMSGGAALPAKVAVEFHEHSGAIIVEGYGLSEASPVTHAGPLDGTAVAGTIGLPIPDTDARIVDPANGTEVLPAGAVGELVVRGPQVMLGYWNDPEATAKCIRDGWLHTGDVASCDERGFFRIVDRIKDLIITSGFNVYPADVEEVLRSYPGVKDVAVIGVPDEERGEIVKAVLVVESEKQFHRREFDEFARERLSAQKRPRIVETQEDDLPRNFLGKVLRRELRSEGSATEAVAEGGHELRIQDT